MYLHLKSSSTETFMSQLWYRALLCLFPRFHILIARIKFKEKKNSHIQKVNNLKWAQSLIFAENKIIDTCFWQANVPTYITSKKTSSSSSNIAAKFLCAPADFRSSQKETKRQKIGRYQRQKNHITKLPSPKPLPFHFIWFNPWFQFHHW